MGLMGCDLPTLVAGAEVMYNNWDRAAFDRAESAAGPVRLAVPGGGPLMESPEPETCRCLDGVARLAGLGIVQFRAP